MYQKRNNEWEILALYTGNYASKWYVRQISKAAKIPLRTTQNALLSLEKKKVLQSKTEGKNKYFGLQRDNIQTKLALLQSEIYRTNHFLEAYPQFKMFLKSLATTAPIILFGSFARGKPSKGSDVDLLVVSEKEQKLPVHLLPNAVHQITLSEDSVGNGIRENEALLKEIQENHIILNNHSFYINVLWEYYEKRKVDVVL